MGAAETALGTAAITVGLAGVVGYFLHRFVDVSEPKTAADYGRKWLGWGLFLACISQLPSFFRKLDANSFAVWILFIVVISPIAFLLGWLHGKYQLRNTSTSELNTQKHAPLEESHIDRTRTQATEILSTNNNDLKHVESKFFVAPSNDDADAPNMLSEKALYEVAWNELEVKKGDKGLWAKAYSSCDGEKEKAKAYYIRERVRFLSEKQNAKLAEYKVSKVAREQKERSRQFLMDLKVLMELKERRDKGEYISVADLKAKLIEAGYLDSKFSIDKRDANDRTPLMKAAMNGDKDAVLMLLIAGADKTLLSPFGDIPSEIARKAGYKEIASMIDEF